MNIFEKWKILPLPYKILLALLIIVGIGLGYSFSSKKLHNLNKTSEMRAIDLNRPSQDFLMADGNGNLSTMNFGSTPLNSNLTVKGNIISQGDIFSSSVKSGSSKTMIYSDANNTYVGGNNANYLTIDNSGTTTVKGEKFCIGEKCITKNDLQNLLDLSSNLNTINNKINTINNDAVFKFTGYNIYGANWYTGKGSDLKYDDGYVVNDESGNANARGYFYIHDGQPGQHTRHT